MFALDLYGVPATLVNFNPRAEKNGKERVPAADLSIRVARNADVLAYFAPTLKSMIFDHAGPRDLAEGMPLRDKHMVYPLKRDEEMTGATVTIEYGVNETIELADCRLKGFELTPHEGGTVFVDFTVQCKPDAHKHVPFLYLLQQQGITLSIEPRDEEELPELGGAAA